MEKKNVNEVQPLVEGSKPEKVFGETLDWFVTGKHVRYRGETMTLREAIIKDAHMGGDTVTDVLHGNAWKTEHYFRVIGAIFRLTGIKGALILTKMEIKALFRFFADHDDEYLEDERRKNTCRKKESENAKEQ